MRKIRILAHKMLRAHNPYTYKNKYNLYTQNAKAVLNKITRKNNILSVMARGEKDKSTQVDCDWTKSRKVNVPISLKDLIVKDMP